MIETSASTITFAVQKNLPTKSYAAPMIEESTLNESVNEAIISTTVITPKTTQQKNTAANNKTITPLVQATLKPVSSITTHFNRDETTPKAITTNMLKLLSFKTLSLAEYRKALKFTTETPWLSQIFDANSKFHVEAKLLTVQSHLTDVTLKVVHDLNATVNTSDASAGSEVKKLYPMSKIERIIATVIQSIGCSHLLICLGVSLAANVLTRYTHARKLL